MDFIVICLTLSFALMFWVFIAFLFFSDWCKNKSDKKSIENESYQKLKDEIAADRMREQARRMYNDW